MKSYELLTESIDGIHNHRYLQQIPTLNWQPINRNIWETIQDEGLDEEQESYSPKDWVMASLPLSPEDISGLQNFEEDTVEDFNMFDIGLKERFPGYVDLIDYDAGTVTIVKTIGG